jgi:hypothetical protein
MKGRARQKDAKFFVFQDSDYVPRAIFLYRLQEMEARVHHFFKRLIFRRGRGFNFRRCVAGTKETASLASNEPLKRVSTKPDIRFLFCLQSQS